jgi:penicillin-binding protein 1A
LSRAYRVLTHCAPSRIRRQTRHEPRVAGQLHPAHDQPHLFGRGRVIDEFARERRLFTAAEEIPDLVKQAFISAEDKNFYQHQGYDARGIAAAMVEAVQTRGQSVRGASTITQQVMKNFLLSATADRAQDQGDHPCHPDRRDADKERILELYLNEIFLGQNSYGVTAAAQTYFNKTLSRADAARGGVSCLAAQGAGQLPPRPRNGPAASRRNFVLKEMYENGYIAEGRDGGERAEPLRSVQNGDFEPTARTLPPRDYFTDEIRRQLSARFWRGGVLYRRLACAPRSTRTCR